MLSVCFCAGAAVLSLLLCRVAFALAEKAGLVSRPNPLITSQLQPVALGGGIVLLALLLPAAAGLAGEGLLPWRLFWLLLPVGLVGLADDLFELHALSKLGLQCLALLPYLLLGGYSPPVAVLALLWLLAVQNAWNFLDILDGLAGWTAVLALGAAAAILHLTGGAQGPAALAAAGAGAALGFLFWNSYPARIYLGDTGSLVLGALHGALVLEAAGGGGLALAWPLALGGAVPLFEMTFVLSQRVRRGLPFYHPSADSFALRLLHHSWSVPDIVRRVRQADLALAGLALGAWLLRAQLWAIPLTAVVVGLAAWRAGKHFQSLPVPTPKSPTTEAASDER